MQAAHNGELILIGWLIVAFWCGLKFWEMTAPWRQKNNLPKSPDYVRQQLERVWHKSSS